MCQHDISEILKNEIINVHLLIFSFRILITIVTMNVFSCTQQVKETEGVFGCFCAIIEYGEQKPEMAFYRAVFFLLKHVLESFV